MKPKLRYYGDPVLRKPCEKIEKITPEIIQLAFDIVKVMDENNGVGLAANQVGYSYRLFVIRPIEKNEKGEPFLGKPEIYINPEITIISNEKEIMEEGCLSIPGLHAEVERPVLINIKAQDLNGHEFSQDVSGYKARELLHENDHLNGVFFVDRVNDKIKEKIKPFLKKIQQMTQSN